LISVFISHEDLIFSQKHIVQAFSCTIFFTRIHLTRYLSSVVNLIAVTTLLMTFG